MQQITITKRADGTYRRIVPAQLMYKGEGPQGNCYEPDHKKGISRKWAEHVYHVTESRKHPIPVITVDAEGTINCQGATIYNGSYHQWLRSEQRKEQLWNAIVANRAQLKNLAMTVQHRSANTIVRPVPAVAKRAINTMESIAKLWDKIVNYIPSSYSQIQQMQLS